MEILAPAGDWESLAAAVNAGADAVYLGGKDFNARRLATNFDRPELEKAADFLHLRGRRLYVTFNTLIAPEELETAMDYAVFLREIGVDAVILQDLGLLSLIREFLPDLPTHASTQMTVHDAGGVQFLEDLGVVRVVLARELSLPEIRAIRQACRAELEVFVHGALCVSYSGACLFSSLIGGRSGNRGRCAQPCRLEYELERDGEPVLASRGPHLLSPKDLCLLPELSRLAEAGVHSLKIEGRMKGPEYVATVVRAYRRAVDRLLELGEFKPDAGTMEDLSAVFNRGFCPGYLQRDLDVDGMSPGRPSNRGQFIGRVAAYDPESGRAVLDLQAGLAAGDGLEFWVTRGGRRGQLAEDMRFEGRPIAEATPGQQVSLPVAGTVYPGDRVFRTSSVRIRKQLAEAWEVRLPCRAFVKAVAGEPLEVVLADMNGHQIRVSADQPLARAQKHPATPEMLRAQLERLGGTPFRLEELEARIEGGPLVPLSLLNALRREAATALERLRLARTRRSRISVDCIRRRLLELGRRQERKGRPRITVFAGSPAAVEAAAKAGADRVYFGGEELLPGVHWGEKQLTECVGICREKGSEPVIALPRITRPRDRNWLENYCRMAEKAGAEGLLLCHPGQLSPARRLTSLPLYANHTFNIFNTAAAALLERTNLAGVALSPELALGQARRIWETLFAARLEIELVVHGALELMVSQFCAVAAWAAGAPPGECGKICRKGSFALRDRKGYLFPIYTDQFCRMHLFNSVDLVMVGEMRRFAGLNLLLRLELRERSPEEVSGTVSLYREALESSPQVREGLIRRAQRLSGRGMTRGHYFRGVD